MGCGHTRGGGMCNACLAQSYTDAGRRADVNADMQRDEMRSFADAQARRHEEQQRAAAADRAAAEQVRLDEEEALRLGVDPATHVIRRRAERRAEAERAAIEANAAAGRRMIALRPVKYTAAVAFIPFAALVLTGAGSVLLNTTFWLGVVATGVAGAVTLRRLAATHQPAPPPPPVKLLGPATISYPPGDPRWEQRRG